MTQVHKLLHGEEDTVCGDSGYTGADKHENLQDVDAAALDCREAFEGAGDEERTRAPLRQAMGGIKASVRAKVEHTFRVIKRQFGYAKVRYRGLAKSSAQVLTLFALSNLWMARRHLLPAVG